MIGLRLKPIYDSFASGKSTLGKETTLFHKLIYSLTVYNICRVDPRAVTEDLGATPLEIAAINENTGAFDLLSPFYEESTKKKMAQLWIWALTDWVPSAAFAQLFASVPLDEVKLK